MTTILITGAAGFIGSHSADFLLAAGHRVIGVDNFRTGRRANLAAARRCPNFHFQKLDVTKVAALDALVQRIRPDAILHLAALVSVAESIAQPALNFELNVAATQTLAEIARLRRVPRIVFASSAAVYGDGPSLARENSPTHPLSPYGAAKLASEEILLGHAATFGLTVRCQRYFNVYGPRQDPHSPYSGVISIFLEKLRAGKAPVIFGDGRQTRDFIDVRDVARANALALTRPNISTGVANICTGHATRVNQLVALLRRRIPGASAASFQPARPGDIRTSCGAPTQARRDLAFVARVKIADGLAALAS